MTFPWYFFIFLSSQSAVGQVSPFYNSILEFEGNKHCRTWIFKISVCQRNTKSWQNRRNKWIPQAIKKGVGTSEMPPVSSAWTKIPTGWSQPFGTGETQTPWHSTGRKPGPSARPTSTITFQGSSSRITGLGQTVSFVEALFMVTMSKIAKLKTI